MGLLTKLFGGIHARYRRVHRYHPTKAWDLASLTDRIGGGHGLLKDVADIGIAPAQSVIYRENDSRRIDVSANVEGTDLGTVAKAIDESLAGINFPLGHHAEVIGEYAERQAAQNRLLLFGIAAAIGVFLILLASFGNLRLAVLGFLTLPSALVGGLLAAYLTGGEISLGSLVGFLTVFGIAARNKIMLINHYQHLERHEGEAFGFGACIAWRGRTAFSDPDDRPGHRTGTRTSCDYG